MKMKEPVSDSETRLLQLEEMITKFSAAVDQKGAEEFVAAPFRVRMKRSSALELIVSARSQLKNRR